MRDRIFCVPITVISVVGAVVAAAVTAMQFIFDILTVSLFSIMITAPLLLADVMVAILLFVGIRRRRPKLILPILVVTVVNVIIMSIQLVFAVWALSSNESPLAQAIMQVLIKLRKSRLYIFYPWIYGTDEDWKIENTQLEVHGIAQALTTEFAILIPLTLLFFIAHFRTYKIVRVRRRLAACRHAPSAHVMPSAYAYPSPLASPQDGTKPPSYSLVVEKPTLVDPTGGEVEKVKI